MAMGSGTSFREILAGRLRRSGIGSLPAWPPDARTMLEATACGDTGLEARRTAKSPIRTERDQLICESFIAKTSF